METTHTGYVLQNNSCPTLFFDNTNDNEVMTAHNVVKN